MKKVVSVVSLCLVAALLLCSCGGGQKAAIESDYKFEKTLPDGYPVEGVDEVITWWQTPNAAMAKTAGNRGETPFAKQIERETGIKVEYIHPATGQVQEQFNLMVASGDLPDIVSYSWSKYPGGPDAAIAEKLILPLNDIIENGGAPALKARYEKFPEEEAYLMSDNGVHYAFPSLPSGEDDSLAGIYTGQMIRKDLLDKAGLAVPETVEELETALIAFKEMGVDIPIIDNPYIGFMDSCHSIISGFGIGFGLYLQDGKVQFGPLQPEFKEYAATMKKWYDMGLLDEEFAVENNKRKDSLFVSGEVGVIKGAIGSTFGRLIPILEESVPGAEMVPLPSLTHIKGQRSEFGHYSDSATALGAISYDCKNPELAAKLLDYGFTEKGMMSYNFGEEGVSYTMVDNYPTYTELITNPEKSGGLSVSEGIAKYTGAGSSNVMIGHDGYTKGYYTIPIQVEALELWADTNAAEHHIPSLPMKPEESEEFSAIKTDVDTYREEMLYKFINGTESLDNYDKFVQTLKDMGVERMIEIQQQVYDRYIAKIAK